MGMGMGMGMGVGVGVGVGMGNSLYHRGGLRSRRSRLGYGSGCQDCIEIYGEHICGCQARVIQSQLEYIEVDQATTMGYGCDCEYCPYENYGNGLYGGRGPSM
jgi:hypothetical protein